MPIPRYLLEIEASDQGPGVTAELLDRESSHIVLLAPDPMPLREVVDNFYMVAMFINGQPFSGRFPGREENGERGVHISTEIYSTPTPPGPEVSQHDSPNCH